MITVPHDMPITVNDAVLSYLGYFQTHRGKLIVETRAEAAGDLRADDRRVLKEEGVPQDLMHLAQAESAFQPQAVSRAGARGIWQFMTFRGAGVRSGADQLVDRRAQRSREIHARLRRGTCATSTGCSATGTW